jgi:hypothetical protein
MAEHEIKYVIGNNRSLQIVKWLETTCRKDPEFPEGTVSSIYFDTKTWRCLNEKLNSDYLKTKIRIRWYADLENCIQSERAFVEAKLKTGAKREKIRRPLSLSGEQISQINLDDAMLLKIPQLLYGEGVSRHGNVFPVFDIAYKRLRFIDPLSNARICFDFDIRTLRSNPGMIPCFNPFILNTAVFELKGETSHLPLSLYPLISMGFRKASFSKYSACYYRLTQIR